MTTPTSRRDDRERGFVMVWTILVLTVLVGMAALSVDVIHAYVVAQQAQNAADAAALAAAPAMPDLAAASTTADRIAHSNLNPASLTPAPTAGTYPNQVTVSVQGHVDFEFAPIFKLFGCGSGCDGMDITRSSTAEYDPPVPLGSRGNTFGNQPGCGVCGPDPNFWASASGPAVAKQHGNAPMEKWCDDQSPHLNPGPNDLPYLQWGPFFAGTDRYRRSDNCTAGTENNPDYERDGELFAIDVHTAGSLDIQVFDPAFVNVGATCDDAGLRALFSATPDPVYAVGPSSLCTGDQDARFEGQAGLFTTHDTGATVSDADGTHHLIDWLGYEHDVDLQHYAQRTRYALYGPFTELPTTVAGLTPTCDKTVNGFDSALDAYADSEGQALFRRWWPFTQGCAPSAQPGERYILQIQTDLPGPHLTQGVNNFAIAATTTGTFDTNTSVSLYSVKHLGIFTNQSSTKQKFDLARVIPSSTRRTLHLAFFDIGDGAGAPRIDVTINPPPDASSRTGGSYPLQCETMKPPGVSSGQSPWISGAPPWGTLSSPGCTMTGLQRDDSDPNASYNGQWISVDIDITNDYDCDWADPAGCWFTITMTNTGGPATIRDVSTWTARFDGLPDRITR